MLEAFVIWMSKILGALFKRVLDLPPDEGAEVFAQLVVPLLTLVIGICFLLQVPPFSISPADIEVVSLSAAMGDGEFRQAHGFALIVEPSVEKTQKQVSLTWQRQRPDQIMSSLPIDILRANQAKITSTSSSLELSLPLTGFTAPYLIAANEAIDSTVRIDGKTLDAKDLAPRTTNFASLAVLALFTAGFGTGLYFQR